jgi:hypothetical protein
MYARFHMVPELDSTALCAPVCSGTGGLTQTTSTRGGAGATGRMRTFADTPYPLPRRAQRTTIR